MPPANAIPPQLRLTALDALPMRYRTIAKAAMRGSLSDLELVVSHLESDSRWADNYAPVLYELLRRPIPSFESTGETEAVDQAFTLVLSSLCLPAHFNSITRAATQAIWDQLWPWIVPAADYYKLYHRRTRYRAVCLMSAAAIHPFLDGPAMIRYVAKAPGFDHFLGRAWAVCVELESNNQDQLSILYDNLAILRPVRSDLQLAMGIEADWDSGDLTSFLLKRLSGIASNFDPAVHRADSLLEGILSVVNSLYYAINDASYSQWIEHYSGRLSGRRATRVLMRVVTRVVDFVIAKRSLEDQDDILIVSIGLVLNSTIRKPGFRGAFCAAVDGGLLRILRIFVVESFLFSYKSLDNELREQIDRILETLPGALLHIHALRAIARQRTDLVSADPAATPRTAKWNNFVDLALRRIAILESYDATPASSRDLRICNNLKCSRIAPWSFFRRCAGCRQHYYCDRQCQEVAWRSHHRNASCALARKFPAFPKEMDRFLRFVLLEDCRSQALTVLFALLFGLHTYHRPLKSAILLLNYAMEGRNGLLSLSPSMGDETSCRGTVFAEWVPKGKFILARMLVGVDAGTSAENASRFQRMSYVLCTPYAQVILVKLAEMAGKLPANATVNNLRAAAPDIYAELVQLSSLDMKLVFM
ncbi:hypothetical protein MKEN_00280300 [Mycena kentingensis (nom. inval.)]|nr:hypothetical protein MKEN_00280300 [Mycena kentingensis (nom. inval.)]